MILIDTCILLQVASEVPLSPKLKTALTENPWAISSLSAWEIGIKNALGKLPLPQPPAQWWPRACELFSLNVLDFSDVIALSASALPPLHADPFDRGIIATALHHNLSLVSVDRAFAPYRQASGITLIDGL